MENMQLKTPRAYVPVEHNGSVFYVELRFYFQILNFQSTNVLKVVDNWLIVSQLFVLKYMHYWVNKRVYLSLNIILKLISQYILQAVHTNFADSMQY